MAQFAKWQFAGQFDEVDEGTAIFKVAEDASQVPDQGNWLTLDADGYRLPSDWYTKLCGEAQKMLEGATPLTQTIPLSRPLVVQPACPPGG